MSRNFIDMTDQRFGMLVCLFPSERKSNTGKYWECACDCGNKTEVLRGNLTAGHVTSCGCIQKEIQIINGLNAKRHGHAALQTPTYTTWEAMRQRCNNPNNQWFHRYGGRGIKVCERWNKFENFLADMGERPEGKTIERNDNNGNYEPSNCEWATAKEQSFNRIKYVSS